MTTFFLKPGQWPYDGTAKSRTDLLKKRVTVYVCAGCWHWHESPDPITRQRTEKPMQCKSCQTILSMPGDVITFPSKIEAQYASELRLRQAHGLVRDLEFHPKLRARVEALEPFKGGKDMPIDYTPDGRYTDVRTGLTIIYDVKPKGKRIDPLYNMKRKLFSGLLGIEIQTIRR